MVKSAGMDSAVSIDSAGTHAYHIGSPPDIRASTIAAKRSYDITSLVARQIRQEDFRDHDLILAMDWENLSLLQQQCPKQFIHKLQLMMRFATEHDEATVPDPYYGGPDGFEVVVNYLEDACTGLLELARKRATQFAAA
jgi:protein-tyrosine phosphatase